MSQPIPLTNVGSYGFTCWRCQTIVPPGATHYCTASPTAITWLPIRMAWTCPVCGNGCAPHVDVCSHAKASLQGETKP